MEELNLDQPCPVVVFYDCCVPVPQFRTAMGERANFAIHIFAREAFGSGVCNDDRLLFSRVEKERMTSHPGRVCILVTQDRRFRKKVQIDPALDCTVFLVVLARCNSVFLAKFRAEDTADRLVNSFAEIRKQAGRLITRETAFGILKKHFYPRTA